MAQALPGIARAGKHRWGYDPAQVDAFLEHAHVLYDSEDAQLDQRDIQNVSFDPVKDGYVIAQVDAALGRLERAVVDKQTTWEISREGRIAWKARTEEMRRQIAEHASRVAGQRFKPGEPKQPSYDRKQVDRLIDRVAAKASAWLDATDPSVDGKAAADPTANSVSNAVFTQRRGRHGYDERQVDYFLGYCVQLLSRLESYARVSGDADMPSAPLQAADESQEGAAQTANAADVTPLFPGDKERSDAAPVAEPATYAPVRDDSFSALHQAEQTLFAPPAQPNASVQMNEASPLPVPPQTPVTALPPSFEPSGAQHKPHVAVPMTAQAAVAQEQSKATAVIPNDQAEEEATAPAEAPVPTGEVSLADLAQMAQASSQEIPTVPSFDGALPSLDIPDLTFPTLDDGIIGVSGAPRSQGQSDGKDEKKEQ